MTREVQCHQTTKLRVEVARKMGTKAGKEGNKDGNPCLRGGDTLRPNRDYSGSCLVRDHSTPSTACGPPDGLTPHHTATSMNSRGYQHPMSVQTSNKKSTSKAPPCHTILEVNISTCWDQENHK